MPACLLARYAVLLLLLGSACATCGEDSAGKHSLAIATQALPHALAGQYYSFQLLASDGVTPLSWHLLQGKLPPGVRLSANSGLISGVPTYGGDFHVVIEATDSSAHPMQAQQEFILTVNPALAISWGQAPAVQDSTISGQIVISNYLDNAIDLTVIVLAVNEIGKAFALGYQRFTLPARIANQSIPFASSLPVGTYTVHADAIAEAPDTNSIYRVRQTSGPLAISPEF